jgi:hypothetical protein
MPAVSVAMLECDGSEDMAIVALPCDAVKNRGGDPRLAGIRTDFDDWVADL